MAGLARLFLGAGLEVSGSDSADTPILRVLGEAGVRVFVGHAPENLDTRCDLVVRTSAVKETNPEVAAAVVSAGPSPSAARTARPPPRP